MNLKISRLAFIGLLAIPMGACSSAPLSAPVGSFAPEAMATAQKALIAAHGLHTASAETLTLAANSNLCKGQCASQAKVYLDQSFAYLTAADAAVALGDAASVQAKIQASIALVYQIHALIPNH